MVPQHKTHSRHSQTWTFNTPSRAQLKKYPISLTGRQYLPLLNLEETKRTAGPALYTAHQLAVIVGYYGGYSQAVDGMRGHYAG